MVEDKEVQRVADIIHAEFQRDFPTFTQRKLDAMDEATGVAERFRQLARERLARRAQKYETASGK